MFNAFHNALSTDEAKNYIFFKLDPVDLIKYTKNSNIKV